MQYLQVTKSCTCGQSFTFVYKPITGEAGKKAAEAKVDEAIEKCCNSNHFDIMGNIHEAEDMIPATRKNTKLGDTVMIPIHNEYMSEEQICLDYEVVLAFKCKTKPDQQIIGHGQEPMPEFIEFNDQMAYRKNNL